MPHNHRPAVGPRETAPDAVVHDPDAAHRATTPEAVAAHTRELLGHAAG